MYCCCTFSLLSNIPDCPSTVFRSALPAKTNPATSTSPVCCETNAALAASATFLT